MSYGGAPKQSGMYQDMRPGGGPGMIGAPYPGSLQDRSRADDNWASPGNSRSRYNEGSGSPTGWGASGAPQRNSGSGWGSQPDDDDLQPRREPDGWAPGWQLQDDDDDRPGFQSNTPSKHNDSPSKRGDGQHMRRGRRQGAEAEEMVIDDIVEEFIDDENEMDMGGGGRSKKDENMRGGGGRGDRRNDGGFGGDSKRNNLFGEGSSKAPFDDDDTSEDEYREDAKQPRRQERERGGRQEGGGQGGGGKRGSPSKQGGSLSLDEIRDQVRNSKHTKGLKDGVMKAMPGSTQGKTGWYHTTSDGDVLVAFFHLGNGNWTQISRAIPLDQWEQVLSKAEEERLAKLEEGFRMNEMANELFSDDKGKGGGGSRGGSPERRKEARGAEGGGGGGGGGKYNLDYASDMKGFLTKAIPKEAGILHCYVIRHKSALSPCYTMFLEDDDVFMLFGKKMPKNMTLHYRISMEQGMSNKNDEGFLGKLRATKRKTEFCLYDHGLRPKDIRAMGSKLPPEAAAAIHKQEELCGITFNAIGYQNSQTKHHMYVTFPEVEDGNRKGRSWRPEEHQGGGYGADSSTGFTMLDEFAANNENPEGVGLNGLMQKPPVLNRETGRYAQNFHGRVTAASIKNVQLCHQNDQEQDVIFQFGRVGPDRFTCDFKHPLSPIQAFAIALTRFHYK